MNILEEILEYKKEEVKKLKQRYSLSSFKEMEFFEKPTLKLKNFIREDSLGIIAEIKKASPSKGIIRKDFNHLKIAEIYFEEEVSAVSILTDEIFFKGNKEYLRDIARIKQCPLLRKDFILDEHQVFESKANGADMVLLICEVLSKNQINELSHIAYETGMEVLLELHSEDQLNKIDFTINKLIGTNNRNLNDFTVDLSTTKKLRKKIPDEIIVVSESGLSKKDDIKYLYDSGANVILVGEYLMRENDIRSKLKELKEWCLISQRLTS
jgi:indole-3-glycerol phosphate synthase